MDKSNNLFPTLRFKNFHSSWQIKELGELASIYDGTHQTPKYKKSGVRFVSVENISNLESSEKYISEEDFITGFKHKPKFNDILMTRITAGVIGATALVSNDAPLAYYVSLALIRCTAGVTPPFLQQRIESAFFKKELHKRIIHVAFPKKINLGDIGKCKLAIPSTEEQQKIAAFLISVDKKLNKLRRKHELLETYKRGLMQKIFSQEIRFKQEDGSDFPDWEEKTIEDVFDWIKTNSLSREKLTDEQGKIQNIHYGDIHTKFPIHFYQSQAKAPFIIDAEVSFPDHVFCHEGDVIIADASEDYDDIGKAIEIMQTDKHSLVAGLHTYIARPKQKLAAGYAGYVFKVESVRLSIKKIAQGVSVLGISKTNLEKVKIPYPQFEEQQQIANILYSVDQKVIALCDKIEGLESFKKALLQKMFV